MAIIGAGTDEHVFPFGHSLTGLFFARVSRRCRTVPNPACTIEHCFLQIQPNMVTQGVCDGSTTKDKDHGRVS